MKRADGTEYKEGTVKTIWNISAKLVQKKFYGEFNREKNPFRGVIFEDARRARVAKRKKLQTIPEKRKTNSVTLKAEKINRIISIFDENTPDAECDNYGQPTGRIEYNTIFSKTAQGGEKHTAESKWLTPNKNCEDKYPVRLLKKMLSKRTPNIKTNRLFLTPNPDWQKTKIWYKNCPVGLNKLSKWTLSAAESIGLDTKKQKISNHSNRSSAVSILAQSGANLQEIIKITGHSSSESLKPHLKLTNEHHGKILEKIRNKQDSANSTITSTSTSDSTSKDNTTNIYYNNCKKFR
ncbi:hypothetical protein WA026_022863 [Henosepilachna vigintioctopunctata]|uniref:Tyr recombinase domain-containing protein n=1 Tax=Henosepilachna vigintioctopunctata TaxID=420089 RepID=A0AAW1UD22_9CUCU